MIPPCGCCSGKLLPRAPLSLVRVASTGEPVRSTWLASQPVIEIGVLLLPHRQPDNVNEDAQDGWYQWMPDNAEGVALPGLARAVAEFESVNTNAGHEASRWLREDALLDYPSTITYVLASGARIDGYFAIASGSVTLEQEHRREFAPEDSDYLPAPIQGASYIEWFARHRDGETPGRKIVLYALSVAQKVAHMQGTPVVVLDPYDHETATLLKERYTFRRSRTFGGNDVRLWVPLYPE